MRISMLLRALLLLLPAAVCVAAAAPATSASAPRIGLFPVSSDLQLLSYREWLTVMGAHTFVLPKSASEAEAERLFQSMDGMLLPGVPMSVLADETAVELERGPDSLASKLLDKALAANRAGTRFFPVWGTCLGFEWLTEFFGGNQAIAHGFDSVDWPQPLTFTPDSPGRMFGRMPPSLLHALANQNITYNLHSAGITPLSERNNPKLASAVNVLATSVDRKGKRFVAAMEHRSLPFYGTQFHPEKPDFVPNSPKTHIPKQPEARAVGLYLAEFFVNATRAGVQQRQQQSQQL